MVERLAKISRSKLQAAFDAGRERDEQETTSRRKPQFDDFLNEDLIKIKNSTGGDLVQGSVLKIGNELLSYKQRGDPWFDGDTPDAADNQVAVLLEPTKDGKISPAQVSSRCIARVNITDITHGYANPQASGEVLLSSAAPGSFRLLGSFAATGEQDAWVIFQQPRTIIYRAHGTWEYVSSAFSATITSQSPSDFVDIIPGYIRVIPYTTSILLNATAKLVLADASGEVNWQRENLSFSSTVHQHIDSGIIKTHSYNSSVQVKTEATLQRFDAASQNLTTSTDVDTAAFSGFWSIIGFS